MTNLKAVSKIFAEKPTDDYKCPNCANGRLVAVQESFIKDEPKFSKLAHGHEDWDPDWIDYRFSFKLRCNSTNCGEVSFASGKGYIDFRYDYDGSAEYYEAFEIMSFFPAPALMEIPEEAPSEVRGLIEKSFALYWVDTSSAANALRASLEALLDDLKLPSEQADKNGKMTRITLHKRIDLWSAKHPEFAELCRPLKELGNLGSHGGNVKSKHFFGVLRIYEHVLSQLFKDDSAIMKKLAKEILDALKQQTK